jgi:hypothetical protein
MTATSPLFEEGDGHEYLKVGPRHVKPSSDDLLVTVGHVDGRARSYVLDRDQAFRLHAALSAWLIEGWPGVRHVIGGDALRAEDYARRVIEYAPERAAEIEVRSALCQPSGSLAEPDRDEFRCSCGAEYRCGAEIPGGHIVAMIDDPRPEMFAIAETASRGMCGAALRRVPDSLGRDWTYRDERGEIGSDATPDGCRTAAEIKKLPAEAYVLINAYGDYGLRDPFWHNHRPAPCRGEHPEVSAPECHGRPMWAAPGGWTCRERWTNHGYSGS